MKNEDLRFASRMACVSGSAIRELLKLTAKPGMISFAGGNPGSFALPNDDIAEIAHDLLKREGKRLLQYGPTEGYQPLVETLVDYLKEEFSAEAGPEEILPITGSAQGIDLICKVYINPGDTVLVESPTFLGNIQCMRIFEANIVPVPMDENGIILEELEMLIQRHHPKMLYAIPTFQNPTGITMSMERRKAIAALASKYRMLVAEDEPYRSLRYSGTPLPSIKSFDEEGWVVLLGSFSKVIAPGLRVGFMAGNASLIRKCTVCKQSSDVHTATLNQAIVDEYMRRGLLKPHVQEACRVYSLQMNAMLEKIDTIKEIVHHTVPKGGLFIFASIGEGLDVAPLFNLSVLRQVAFVPGEPFYPEGGHKNTLRLNFTNADVGTIHRGMSVLRSCFEETCRKPIAQVNTQWDPKG
ncbi:MAG: PLP-dependent aminotransferase family protein [Eubacteriales bacterium]|nr:PLP-dependent aminotransferase family protein [Eubacteriales bacterium]